MGCDAQDMDRVRTLSSPPELPPDHRITADDGTELATYDFAGEGRDCLLAHATGFCAAVWAPLIAELEPWRRVAFDARAHGRSGGSGGDPGWELHGTDILAVIDALGLHRPIGVGHSMGAAALVLAETARPGTFSSMWLYEPIVFPPGAMPGESNPLAEGALRRRKCFDSPQTAFANFASKPPLNELSDECLSAYVHAGFRMKKDGSVELRCDPRDESACYRMGGEHHGWDGLTGIGCPVTVASGADLAPGPASAAPLIVERLPRGHLEDHPGMGHFGPLAHPVELARSICSTAAAQD